MVDDSPEIVTPRIANTLELPRTIGFWGGVAVMIGVIIGSGIFAKPAVIAASLGSPWLVLAFWLLGGVIALFGALTYSELIAMFPQAGGLYVFLREGYGRPMAFVFGWTYMLIVKPSAAAGIAMLFATHVNRLLGTEWNPQLITICVLVALTTINVLGTELSTRFAGLFTAIKFGSLAIIVVAALVIRKGTLSNFHDEPAPMTIWQAIIPVMAAILWTYDGWSDAGSIAGEIKNPQKTLPRIFVMGTIAVTALYVAVNAVFIWMIPLAQQKNEPSLAPVVMEKLIGPAGGVAVIILILISTLGSSHASIMTGARVTYQQARDGLLFGFLGRVSPKFRTPAVSLWVQCAFSCAAVLALETFDKLADTFTFTMWIFYGLAGMTLFIFRRKRPDAVRLFMCVGYPWIPAIFVLIAAGMTGYSIWQSPSTTLPWVGVLAAGFPVYFLWERVMRPKNNATRV